MKKVLAFIFAIALIALFAVPAFAEEESAMTEIVAETEVETEAETTKDVEIEDILATINSLTPEQFQMLQAQILALSKATGWDALDEFVSKNILPITLILIMAGTIVYFVFFKKNGSKINHGISVMAQRSSEMMDKATKISKESKEKAEEVTQSLNQYLTSAQTIIEQVKTKEDIIVKKDEEIKDLNEQFIGELKQNQGAILALASCVNSLLQMSGIPDEEKAMIRIRYENELRKMEGGDVK